MLSALSKGVAALKKAVGAGWSSAQKKLIRRKMVKKDEQGDGELSAAGSFGEAMYNSMERTAVGVTLVTGGIWLAERDKKAEKEEKEQRKEWENNMEARSIRIEENQEAWGKRLEEKQEELKQSVDRIVVSLEKGKNDKGN